MIAILTVLVALPLGLFVRNRFAAYVIFAIAFSHVYTFQTANLVMEWVNGSSAAFPKTQSNQLLDANLGYFAFTSMIYAVGFALVTLGHWLRNRRRTTPEVRLDQPAT